MKTFCIDRKMYDSVGDRICEYGEYSRANLPSSNFVSCFILSVCGITLSLLFTHCVRCYCHFKKLTYVHRKINFFWLSLILVGNAPFFEWVTIWVANISHGIITAEFVKKGIISHVSSSTSFISNHSNKISISWRNFCSSLQISFLEFQFQLSSLQSLTC